MNYKLLHIIFVIVFLLLSCKSKEKFPEPGTVLQKWAHAIKQLNYALYKRCEKEPKTAPVFIAMYKPYYIKDIMVISVEDLKKSNTKNDDDGKYVLRKVEFECTQVNRSTKRSFGIIRGTMDFVKYIDGHRKRDGWLMWNRTLVYLKK